MSFKKDLEGLETKQEKVIFIRDFILNKKQKNKEKEEAINILNRLLQSENLEDRLEFKPIEFEKKEDIITKQPFIPKLNLNLEEEKIKDRYKTGVFNENKTKQDLNETIIYSASSKTNIKNLRSFLDRKGLLSNPTINKQEISKQITNYLGGNTNQNTVDRYFAMFSQDSIEYQAFSKNKEEEETNISGRKIDYYKIIPKEEKR
jgi:hypothetical protein